MPLDALVSGRIATFVGNAGFGWVEAVGIRDGRVAFAGSAVDLESRADPFTRRFELEPDEIAIPGLTDAHLHLGDAALAGQRLDLSGAGSLRDGLALIAAAARVAATEWIEGAGWDQRRWGRWPTAADLRGAAAGRKVALWSFDHHALWVSPAALVDAHLDALTPDPPGGIIRRASDGSPEGVLQETACRLVTDRIPPVTGEFLENAVAAFADSLLEHGLVAVHDPGRLAADPELRMLGVYVRLADRGGLSIRVHASVRADGLERAIDRHLRSGAPLGEANGGRAHVGWLKLFADGTLGSRTAAILDDDAAGRHLAADRRGIFLTEPAELAALADRAAGAGIATQIHAIGDAGVRAALDALEPTVSRVAVMPRVEHVQLCGGDDRKRFAAGIGASVQPVHLREDAETARREWAARAETDGYAWRSLLEDGAVLAFGTDAPIEPVDPWPGIALAVLRRDPSWGADAVPFGGAQALTFEQALRAATVGPATLSREPDRGRLVVGARADLVILPATPSEPTERAAAFAAVRPRLVLVDGEVAFER